jgi:hypothetical protein
MMKQYFTPLMPKIVYGSPMTRISAKKVYREQRPHKGIILLRLHDERASSKIDTLRRLLAQHADQLADDFVVATETRVRLARL